MKSERIPRKDMIKKVDMTVPINIEILGSKDDPCFGKLFDPRTDECSRCGDCEICSIVMGQMSHIQRAQIEKKGNFKDLEEDEIPEMDPKELRKKIKSRIREVIRMSPKGITRERIVADVHATFVTYGFSKDRIGKILDKLTDITDKFKYNTKKDLYLWNNS